ncbi:exodeoxyribonuclease V subunit alpha [Psychrosphaera ytuae]|uniref:RecBCD enzyme subunit RecD n=1 Tax=Psychrosphaera ytuae TaxID=2820710 RepID=A0A975DC07_9GAMM|nr:exodeoxyribonuclease V subunit alpha [Psychrosphaera ytuae]QTH64326.1 exodeoxyribonuclease V subunit alpha [Psychrosphaera ytuae]
MDNKVVVLEPIKEQANSIFAQSVNIDGGKTGSRNVSIMTWLRTNKEKGLLTELEFQFANFIARQEILGMSSGDYSEHEPIINLITIMSAHVIRRFNAQSTCFEITDCHIDMFDNQESLILPAKSTWPDCIDQAKSTGNGGPLTFYNGFLFLTRNFNYEVSLANYLSTQSKISPALSFNSFEGAPGHAPGHFGQDNTLVSLLAQLFKPLDDGYTGGPDYDWQRQAVLNSLNYRFSVITGGPGTGKTTTVIKLLAATIYLYEQQASFVKDQLGPLKIALAAPTGKAALRLTESISSNVKTLEGVESHIKSQIPTEATTLHRLLKPRGSGFLYNQNNKLPLDVLILDEASMVDLSMMCKLVDALAPQTQLVLLGDEQQLASVEAGNILAEICQPLNVLTDDEQKRVMPLTKLKHSYRFDAVGGIGKLARAVIDGDVNSVIQILVQNVDRNVVQRFSQATNPKADIAILPQRDIELNDIVRALVPHYSELCHAARSLTVAQEETQVFAMFEQLHQFQILACVRQGDTGVEGLNGQFVQALKIESNTTHDGHFAGRPVLITENAYHLGLFNGDIGIQAIEPESGLLVTYFIDAQGAIKRLFNQRLPAHESVYAMTVHKSQGSEFSHGLLVLPPEGQAGALLSKELLYTAITRAKKQFTIYGSSAVIKKMVATHTSRQSGLNQMLKERGGLF